MMSSVHLAVGRKDCVFRFCSAMSADDDDASILNRIRLSAGAAAGAQYPGGVRQRRRALRAARQARPAAQATHAARAAQGMYGVEVCQPGGV